MYFLDDKNNTNIDDEFNEKKSFKVSKALLFGAIIGILVLLIIGVLLFRKPKREYFLTLNGQEDIVIYQGMEFVDAGYQAYDNRGNEYNQEVVVTGEVDTSVAGEYRIIYSYNGIEKERIVTVLAKTTQLTFLILKGNRTMYLKQGEKYQEPGFNVIDTYDDKLHEKVEVSGDINSNEPGTYKIKYSVINHLGVEFVEERTIIVLGSDVSINVIPKDKTKGNVEVSIGVVDNYFDYILYPDNSKGYDRYSVYKINENGKYKFVIYSKDGSYKEEVVEINNIDKEKPNGSCTGYYKEGKSYIEVSATDNMSGISKYMINNQSFTKKSLVVDGEMTSVSVNIYDGVGNDNAISCTLEDKNPVTPPPTTPAEPTIEDGIVMCDDKTIYHGTKYTLTTSQKEKLAAMVFNEAAYNFIGMKAVASHMGNLYEVRKFNGKTDASFYDYISTTTWYSYGTRTAKYDPAVMSNAYRAVEEVLVGGNRILPLYIDSFDLFPKDIVNSMDKKKYVQGETKYQNIYGTSNDAKIFWCFNLNSKKTSGNIFGYSIRNQKYKNYIEGK